MSATTGETAAKLMGGAADLIARNGYSGFSYADLAERFGLRKASIHYHFPSKTDLVVAVVEQGRARIASQIAVLEAGAPVATEQLRVYVDFWRRCIRDGTVPFCLAAVLGAELPGLPDPVAQAVRRHFADLADWLSRVLALGAEQQTMRLPMPASAEAEILMATIYGAMLAARAFDDPDRFDAIVEAALARIRA
ncbi:TetR/AcrR family transcriptional regulator [Acetobacteraceae bacterium KSS8]|uniref:TetR/AcrR family transcriptional regulator n=1 Tax=Endosaccharibacter trunci TaxID=2812733 RepID=A0ABT1W9J0_9PROT|nr:TetR/AcrR family transcriptional regulator [Acetobacteraceae bacterium KSS8]